MQISVNTDGLAGGGKQFPYSQSPQGKYTLKNDFMENLVIMCLKAQNKKSNIHDFKKMYMKRIKIITI